ncbi:hypothetical protein WDU94_003329 [Cyamophila willieti]
MPGPCGLYEVNREVIPASYWNNPHVCDVQPSKLSPAVVTKPRRQRRNVPRWAARKPIMDNAQIRQERMNEQQERVSRLRLLKHPSNISLAPVEGRLNVSLQTCDYLEALYEDPPTATKCTQTRDIRPQTPPFIPVKSGVDTCTQVYPDDLFFFDEEVKPILEVTTVRTIEQALQEVLHQDEIDGMEKERRRFLDEKSAEEAELQRLEEEEQRKQVERENRIAELERAKQKQKKLEDRIAAAMLSERVCKELLPQVLDEMTAEGYYVDDVEKDILNARDTIMDTLENEVCEELRKIALSEDTLSNLVKAIVQERYDVYTELGEHPKERFVPGPPQDVAEEIGIGDEMQEFETNFE